MPPVFGRYFPNPHAYDDALTLMQSQTLDERAVAINLRCDHRVSMERERSFDTYVTSPCTDMALRRALKDYFEEKVRPRKLPHYVYADVNASNLLNGRAGIRPIIKPDLRLVRILDLNGLKGVFQWAQTEGEKKYPGKWGRTFDRFPADIANDGAVMDFLDKRMTGHGVDDFVLNVLDLLYVHGVLEKKPFQPVWATTWAAFKDHMVDGPDRWLEVLGVDKPNPCWLVLLRYTVREAGTVARPTQLDGGWYEFHFPSPPQAFPSEGGHPMDLRTLPRSNKLLPEYVHKQIRHLPGHWTALAPNNYGRTTAPTTTSIYDQRQTHHQLLVHAYGTEVLRWMSKPI